MTSQPSCHIYILDKDKSQWYKVERGLLGGLYLEKTDKPQVDGTTGLHLSYADSRTLKKE